MVVGVVMDDAHAEGGHQGPQAFHKAVRHLLQEIPEDERNRVIVALEEPDADAMTDGKVCRFTMAIERFESA